MFFCASFSNAMNSGISSFHWKNSNSDFCSAVARAKASEPDSLLRISASRLPRWKALGKSLSLSAGQVLPFKQGSHSTCLVRLFED